MNHPSPERLRAYLREEATPEEVQHIEACAACDAALQNLLQGSPSLEDAYRTVAPLPTPAPMPPTVHALPLPTALGRYRLGRPFSQRSMGIVCLANLGDNPLPVVIKMLPGNGSFLTRFRQEVQASSQLQHLPHLVKVLDSGTDQGFEYFVMEYIDGYSLHDLVQHFAPLPIAVACELVRQAAIGLAPVHALKYVHRDVKPANLMLARTGEVKILDLGLVRMPATPGTAPLTEPFITMGTPDFIAPEQVGGAGTVDARADLYSLGCVLYYLLAGVAPFQHIEDPFAKCLAHRSEPVPPLPRPDVPQELLQLLEQLLVKQPEQRNLTAAALANQLLPFAAGCDLRAWLQNPAANIPAPAPAVTPVPVALAPAPVQAALDLLFWDAQERRMRSVREPGVLPVAAGHLFQIEVRLNRPAHVYLLWINPKGVVAPVFPWKPVSAWQPEHPDEPLQQPLLLPRPTDKGYAGWPLTGDAGVETVVLLARDEPLTAMEHTRLPAWMARIAPFQPLPDASLAAWFGCSAQQEAVRERGFDGSAPQEAVRVRGFDPTPQVVDDPLFQIDSLLRDRLGARFSLVQAVSFTNRGKP